VDPLVSECLLVALDTTSRSNTLKSDTGSETAADEALTQDQLRT
jgi:hypothetical protein